MSDVPLPEPKKYFGVDDEPDFTYHTADQMHAHAAAVSADLAAENAKLKTVMIAAAEEIQAHWDAHCDAEGYGPANLMRRLEEGIPSQYSYTAGRFAELLAENARLREALQDDKADLLRDQQRKIGALARYHIETQLVGQLLEEGPNTETTALDMEYWWDQHDNLKAALTERDALQNDRDTAQKLLSDANQALGRMEVERDALRADAARYRWLRDHSCPQVMHPSGYGMGNAIGEQLDAAIDAARAALKGEAS